jgi:hypothetical protein
MKKIYTIFLFLLFFSINSTCAIVKGNFTLSITTGNYFYVDHNKCATGEGPKASYLGIKILNKSGVTQNNIEIEFVKYTDNVRYTLAGGQSITQNVSTLSNNASDTMFWYSTYPCFYSGSGYATNVIFKLKDLDDGTSYLDTIGSLSTEEQISSNGGGLVGTAQVTGQGQVGGIFSYKCDYNYPRLIAGDIAYMQPTVNLSFDAASYQLESAIITYSTANSATCIPVGNCPLNYIVSGNCSAFDITVEYFFRIKSAQTTTAYPYNSATSGAVGTKYVITPVPVYFSPENTLPVELFNYSAAVNEKSVLNTWSTASEFNNNYFSVERSKDALKFEEVGKVKGAGYSNSRMDYSFNDNNPYSGISYYRLRQFDFDGKTSVSPIVSVEFKKEKSNEVKIFPNPSNGILSVDFNNTDNFSDISLQIYDITGRMVLDKNILLNDNNKQVQIDLNAVSKGEYFIFYSASNISKFQKFLIQ